MIGHQGMVSRGQPAPYGPIATGPEFHHPYRSERGFPIGSVGPPLWQRTRNIHAAGLDGRICVSRFAQTEVTTMNWKLLAVGSSSLIGIGAVAGVTAVVLQHRQPAALAETQPIAVQQAPLAQRAQSAVAAQGDGTAARLRETKAECREYAQRQVKKQTGEVLKDSAIGGLIGAGTGAAGGA